MDAVNAVASAASRAIWGEPADTADTSTAATTSTTSEPLSGETGDTKVGEPYDAGNIDSTDTERTVASPTEAAAETSTGSGSGKTGKTTKGFVPAIGEGAETVTSPENPLKGPSDLSATSTDFQDKEAEEPIAERSAVSSNGKDSAATSTQKSAMGTGGTYLHYGNSGGDAVSPASADTTLPATKQDAIIGETKLEPLAEARGTGVTSTSSMKAAAAAGTPTATGSSGTATGTSATTSSPATRQSSSPSNATTSSSTTRAKPAEQSGMTAKVPPATGEEDDAMERGEERERRGLREKLKEKLHIGSKKAE